MDDVEFLRWKAEQCREIARAVGGARAAGLLSLAIELDTEAIKLQLLGMGGNKPSKLRSVSDAADEEGDDPGRDQNSQKSSTS